MRQVGRSVQCRQNRRGRTAATWPSSGGRNASLKSSSRRLRPEGGRPRHVNAGRAIWIGDSPRSPIGRFEAPIDYILRRNFFKTSKVMTLRSGSEKNRAPGGSRTRFEPPLPGRCMYRHAPGATLTYEKSRYSPF